MTERGENAPAELPTSGLPLNSLFAERGDFILASDAMPEPDIIVSSDARTKRIEFRLDALQNYLRFLELIVINERLIVGNYNVLRDLNPALKDSKAFSPLFTRYYLTGSLNLYEGVLETLMKSGILFQVQLGLTDSSPKTQVLKHLPLSRRLRTRLVESRNFTHEYEEDEGVVDELALASLASEVGLPLQISEFACRAQLPYLLTPQQISALSSLDKVEMNVQKSVLTHLLERFNAGARKELEGIAGFGDRTVFPETPLSSQIVMDSARPEDLLQTALQLRDEYKDFRKEMIELEAELLSEDSSLERKIKLQKRINLMAAELWPASQDGIRKEAIELSNVLGVVSVNTLDIGTIAKLTQYLMDKPTDLIIKLLRRRKVRVLLKTRKQFLKSKRCVSKLAELFQVPKNVARDALLHDED